MAKYKRIYTSIAEKRFHYIKITKMNQPGHIKSRNFIFIKQVYAEIGIFFLFFLVTSSNIISILKKKKENKTKILAFSPITS